MRLSFSDTGIKNTSTLLLWSTTERFKHYIINIRSGQNVINAVLLSLCYYILLLLLNVIDIIIR